MGTKARPEEIKDVIQKVIGQLSDGKKFAAGQDETARIVVAALTEKEQQHARVSGLKEQSIFITVDSPAWMFQLNLKKQKILEAIQVVRPDINKVNLKIGKVT